MKFFICEDQRRGTCYHEFYKGKWDGRTFWKSDSILLHDDLMYDGGFVEAIVCVIKEYDPFGETMISIEQWRRIGEIVQSKDDKAKELYKEADQWLKEVFETYDCFTILGI